MARAEAGRRSVLANAIMTGWAVTLTLVPLFPGADALFAGLTLWKTFRLVGPAWLMFEAATLIFHVLGPEHWAYRIAEPFDELCRYGVVFGLIAGSESAVSPLWLLTLLQAYAWAPKTPTQAKFSIGVLTVSHLALASVFLLQGRIGDAFLTGLMFITSTLTQTTTVRAWAQSLRVGAERDLFERELNSVRLSRERDRIARELHDGVAADILALVLRLRMAAKRSPHAATLARKAEGVLGGLRQAVWSLRNEQGTLAELGKLLDARCVDLCRDIAYERSPTTQHAQRPIGPGPALALLTVAHALVREAAASPGVKHVRVAVSADEALALTVHHDGAQRSTSSFFGELTRTLEDVSGTLISRTEKETPWVQVRVTIPLTAEASGPEVGGERDGPQRSIPTEASSP